jgi:Domain of unknown function (DUF4136)
MKALLLLALTALGAFAQKINIEFDPAAGFFRFRTFAIREGRMNSRNPQLNNELVKKRIEADIANDLAARGLVMVPNGPADLNVVYTFGAARRLETEVYPAGWRGWGTAVVRRPYAEGTLVIDLRDATAHSLVWRAIASVEKSNPVKVENKIDDMVRKSVQKYPPKVK